MPEMQSDPLFTDLVALKIESEGLKNLIAKKDEELSHYESENERLLEMIRELKRHRGKLSTGRVVSSSHSNGSSPAGGYTSFT